MAHPGDLDLTWRVEGVVCRLAPVERPRSERWVDLDSAALAATLWFAAWLIAALSFVATTGSAPARSPVAGGTFVLALLGLLGALESLPRLVRWVLEIDPAHVHVRRVLGWFVLSRRSVPLEHVRAIHTPTGVIELELARGRSFAVPSGDPEPGRRWLADRVHEAVQRRAAFWREVLAPERRGDREAVSAIVARKR